MRIKDLFLGVLAGLAIIVMALTFGACAKRQHQIPTLAPPFSGGSSYGGK